MKGGVTFISIVAILLTSMKSKADESNVLDVIVGNPVTVPNNGGDTWNLAWAGNGSLYSPSNDTGGFNYGGGGNLGFNQIIGSDPMALTGRTVDAMQKEGYGGLGETGPDGCTWKSTGCFALDGALYWVIARDAYGTRQTAQNASIIKSLDGGKTWTRSEKENLDHPMFPGKGFATPYFFNYGQDGKQAVADHSDQYVYALSNNGFWDNGDNMVLGRVLRSKIANLSGPDWQYYASGDGSQDSAWSSDVRIAKPVLTNTNHVGETGATYLPALHCYMMIGWYYPAGGGKATPTACKTTVWDFYVAAHPWGPWRTVSSHMWYPQGYYCPGICPKFTSADGLTVWAFAAGNWNDYSVYCLTGIPLTISIHGNGSPSVP